MIDEVHNILAGTYREQRIVLNTLRFLLRRMLQITEGITANLKATKISNCSFAAQRLSVNCSKRRAKHPPSFNSLTGRLTTPVLAMEMTSRPGERRFYAELLTLLGAPQRPRADIAQMEQAALRIMEAIGVQVVVHRHQWPHGHH